MGNYVYLARTYYFDGARKIHRSDVPVCLLYESVRMQ